MQIQAPKRVKARTSHGRVKAAYVFKVLRIKGFEPFDPFGVAHYESKIMGVSLTADRKGLPIQRQIVDGVLMDATWWHGQLVAGACVRCTISDGRARRMLRTIRPSAVRSDNRTPVVSDAGIWHLACLKVRMAKYGRFGHDIAPLPAVTSCKCPMVKDANGILKVKHSHK